jgi:hypothetical protein
MTWISDGLLTIHANVFSSGNPGKSISNILGFYFGDQSVAKYSQI